MRWASPEMGICGATFNLRLRSFEDGSIPRGSGPFPSIVMAHGYAGVKEQLLDQYAEAFATKSLCVLVCDHRNFGGSGGEPRQEVDPVAQIRGYRDAITYAQSRPEIDPSSIGIWGSSYRGGHVLVVGATDRRVKAVVSQVPTISGYTAALRRVTQENVPALLEAFNADRAARYAGKPPVVVPMVSEGSDTTAAYKSSDTAEPKPSAETLLEIYKKAALIKQNDERVIKTMKAGRLVSPYYSTRGQEIIPAAVSVSLDDDDYICTIYRGVHDMLAKGFPLGEFWAELAGKATGTCKGGPMT